MTTERRIDNVWMVSREYEGLAGAGGIKDVARQLAEALARSGRKVSVVLPLYGFMDAKKLGFASMKLAFDVDMNYVDTPRREFVRIFSKSQTVGKRGTSAKGASGSKSSGRLTIYLIDAQRYLEKKSVYTYTAEEEAHDPLHRQGTGHYDYFAMNVLLQKATLALMVRLDQRPAIIHCHDGHAALLPAMLRELEGYRHYFAHTAAVVTIHNAGIGYHQEVDDIAFAEAVTGLPNRVITENLLDGNFDPFLAASPYAPLNTVSENYARELRETDDDRLTGWLGHRLVARGLRLEGITNGINPADFDPSRPKALGLPAAFSPAKGKMDGKRKTKKALVDALAAGKMQRVRQIGTLEYRPAEPLFSFVGRLTTQKGLDKLLGTLETMLPLDQGFQVVVFGSGTTEIEQALSRMAKRNKGRVCFLRGYDVQTANLVYAAGDFFLIPSQYEPCGLTDYIAQLFGNLPIVHHVGGLVKVINGKTGFAYKEHQSAALMGAMQKAIHVFRSRPEKILDMQRTAVQHILRHYTWDAVLDRYLELYAKALKQTNQP